MDRRILEALIVKEFAQKINGDPLLHVWCTPSELQEICKEYPGYSIIYDMTNVAITGSSDISYLTKVHQYLRKNGHFFSLCNVEGDCRSLLKRARIDYYIDGMSDSLESAIISYEKTKLAHE